MVYPYETNSQIVLFEMLKERQLMVNVPTTFTRLFSIASLSSATSVANTPLPKVWKVGTRPRTQLYGCHACTMRMYCMICMGMAVGGAAATGVPKASVLHS